MGEIPGSRYLVGRGIGDITGEPAACGMLGYGKAAQQTQGIHLRLRARAFVIVDTETERRVLLVVCELGLMFESIHREVLHRLRVVYGELYSASNVMLTVTHTHSGPGGYGEHRLYNLTTHGFRKPTCEAILAGIGDAIDRAHRDLAPSTLRLAHGVLHDASTNRSRSAFDRNPPADRAVFPAAVDPQLTVLCVEREGSPVGAVSWFPTHGTSMTNQNTLISSDNKGYAAYHWERVVKQVDYRDPGPVAFVAAFAQTNAGDMSPNTGDRPGAGPTGDETENTRIIGIRQFEAAAGLLGQSEPALTGPVDSRIGYVDLTRARIDPHLAGHRRPHRTTGPIGGAAAIAGTAEGAGLMGFRQGRNPLWDGLSAVVYALSPRLRDSQAPKGMVLPGGLLNRVVPFVQVVAPVQLVRLGDLYLIGIPGEVTIVAGLRLRRTVASIVGAQLREVLVAGYSNGYIHYITTPEEYGAQRYEGGSTLYGRWELLALQQAVAGLARAMSTGQPALGGQDPAPPALPRRPRHTRPVPDEPISGHELGDLLVDALASYRSGETVTVVFVGAHPNNDLRRGGTYLEIQHAQPGETWHTIADDGDWSTTFRWSRVGRAGSRVTITWATADVTAGTYRIRYLGTALRSGELVELVATSAAFRIVAPGRQAQD